MRRREAGRGDSMFEVVAFWLLKVGRFSFYKAMPPSMKRLAPVM
jgi:hypothetical protein